MLGVHTTLCGRLQLLCLAYRSCAATMGHKSDHNGTFSGRILLAVGNLKRVVEVAADKWRTGGDNEVYSSKMRSRLEATVNISGEVILLLFMNYFDDGFWGGGDEDNETCSGGGVAVTPRLGTVIVMTTSIWMLTLCMKIKDESDQETTHNPALIPIDVGWKATCWHDTTLV